MEKPRAGRGHPPVEHQFKKGQSGNPSGRPKKKPSTAELLNKLAKTKVTIRQGERNKRISGEELRIRALVQRALQGDVTANRRVSQVVVDGPNSQLSLTQAPPQMDLRQCAEETAKLLHIPIEMVWSEIYRASPDGLDEY